MVSDGLTMAERRLLQHVVPACPVAHGRPQLPRQRHRLPGGCASRRQLPARDEGHGPDRRAGAARRRAARLAPVRDPAVGAARRRAPADTPRSSRRRLRRQEPLQPAHAWAVPAASRWFRLRCLLLAGLVAADLYYALGAWRAGRPACSCWSSWRSASRPGRARVAAGSAGCSPQFCSIYDPYFWWHERLWKLLVTAAGSTAPRSRPLMWRLLGVRIGRRVFDEGVQMPEKTLVTIGDDVTLNAGTVIQCHSLEDGSVQVRPLGDRRRRTLGVESFVHYGVTMGDRVGARRRRVPDEGRGGAGGGALAGQPGHRHGPPRSRQHPRSRGRTWMTRNYRSRSTQTAAWPEAACRDAVISG